MVQKTKCEVLNLKVIKQKKEKKVVVIEDDDIFLLSLYNFKLDYV